MADNFLYEYTYDLGVSEGFYLTPITLPTDFCGGTVFICGGTQPCSDDRVFQRAEAAARHAVEEHNRKSLGSTLEFLKIVNLNMRCAAGFVYYITVAARKGSDDEARLYEVDVWDMIFSGFRIDIFRPAPYSMKPSDKLGNKLCCVEVNNLTKPWMGEAYLYYKCFYEYKSKIMGVEVSHNEESGKRKGIVWFKNGEEKEDFVKTYTGKSMPHTGGTYSFDC